MQEEAPQRYIGKSSASGVSSFGMSGVNAHAVFAASTSIHESLLTGQCRGCLPWHRRAHWPVPKAHHFLMLSTADRRAGICRWLISAFALQSEFELMSSLVPRIVSHNYDCLA